MSDLQIKKKRQRAQIGLLIAAIVIVAVAYFLLAFIEAVEAQAKPLPAQPTPPVEIWKKLCTDPTLKKIDVTYHYENDVVIQAYYCVNGR